MKKITRLFYFLFLFAFFMPICHSQTIIHTENFEGADFTGYAIGNGDTGMDYPSQTFVTSGADRIGRGLVGSFTFDGIVTGNSTNVIGGEDIDFTTDGGFYNGHSYIELDPVSIAGKTNLSIDIDVAFPNTLANRYELDDFLIVDYRIDGGMYTTVLAFYGDSTIPGLRRDNNLNGTLEGSETTSVNTAMTNFVLNLDAITGSTVSGSSIEIRVRFNMPESQEEFAFDNIILKGIDAPCTNPTVPTITATANPVCSGGSTTLNIAGTLNDATQWVIYTGSCGGTLVGTTSTSSFVVTPTGPSTTYFVRGEGGCVTPGSCGTLTVNVNTVNLAAASQTNVSCFGGSNAAASVTAATGGSAPYTYNWIPGNPPGDGTTSVSGLTAGTWTCTATDANGCTTSQSFTITQPSALTLTPASQTNIACNGGATGAATVNTATGGTASYTYNWTPGNPTGDGTTSVSGLTAGTWTCTVTDANGCTTSQSFTITQPVAALVLTPNSQTNVSCFGGSNGAATVNASTGGTAPYTYNWTPGNPVGDGTTSVSGLTAGTWTCTVTDTNGCTTSQSFTITQPTAITSSISAQTNVSCNSGSNGSATVAVSGGTPGYTYSWAPSGGTAATASGLSAGTYTCTITDANGCTKTQSATITQPSALTLTPASQTNIACNGGATGAATVNTPTGGTAPYTYNWTPGNPSGDGTVSVSGLTAGTWTCTTTDANGCTASQNFTITQPATALVAFANTDNNVSCNGAADGGASSMASGGTPPYTYQWSNGATTAAITGVVAGTYNVTITDANGCSEIVFVNITQPAAIDNTITQSGGVLTANQASASYQWYTCPNTLISGATSQSYTPSTVGDYKVQITSGGCTVESACETVTTLGTENFENNLSFSIYPNPTNGILNIKTSVDGDFIIANQLGQTVKSFKTDAGIENTINVENLADGIYFVKGTNGTQISSQRLLIKK